MTPPTENGRDVTDAPATSRKRRRRRLIRPDLQVPLITHFAVVAAFSLTLQFLLFAGGLARLASELPGENGELVERGLTVLLVSLAISLFVLFPLVILVGIAATFRVAGPLVGIRRFLEQIRSGEAPADLRLREGDHLQDLCELLNEVSRPLRADGAGGEDRRAA